MKETKTYFQLKIALPYKGISVITPHVPNNVTIIRGFMDVLHVNIVVLETPGHPAAAQLPVGRDYEVYWYKWSLHLEWPGG